MKINFSDEKIAEFCKKWLVAELALFGSVLRDDFKYDSDIDVIISFKDEAHPTFFTLARMRNELIDIFGREVDLLTKRSLEMCRNHIRRKTILDSSVTVYVA